jgi:hypothetical protein
MIKLGYCVAYDWELLRYSIPKVYEHTDVICLSIDKNRQSWTGDFFSWDEEGFKTMLANIDPQKKIKIYEDIFYNPALLPMQNEVEQRNKIAAFLGEGGWHVQLDTDEYFLDFGAFVKYLNSFVPSRKANICCPLINLYKFLHSGLLWIKPLQFHEIEFVPTATRHPNYEYGRKNGDFNVFTNFSILHQSWARGEDEMREKLQNWGHAKDFDVQKYFQLWKDANEQNYDAYKNFHHLHPHTWPALSLKTNISGIKDLLNADQKDFPLPITNSDLRKKNSIWLSRAKKIFRNFRG